MSDLAAIIPRYTEEMLAKQYTMVKVWWQRMGGMDGIHTIATGVDKMIQLAIDIDFPHQLPVTSISRQGLIDRMKEVKPVISLYLETLIFKGAFTFEVEAEYDARFEEIADALIGKEYHESRNIYLHLYLLVI